MDSIANPKVNLKYPKFVWRISFNELCERFSTYASQTVLMLYLTMILKFNGDDSTIIYHSFVFFTYIFSLAGAVLADSYWGKFKTIILLSFVYAFGTVILTGASMANAFSLEVQKIIALAGLFLISVGTGGIKPCVYVFGGDQFRLPEQKDQLQQFTTQFMCAFGVGAIFSTFLSPIFREDVRCFGRDTCYPLVFGVSAVMMFVSIAVFVSGKNVYTKNKPDRDAVSKTFGCIYHALRTKLQTSSGRKHVHWLDYAEGACSEANISTAKKTLNVITVFVTYPLFFALSDQQSSRWTLQATLMNGRLEFLNWTVKPDQMHILAPILGLIFLVLFKVAVYSLLRKIGIRTTLQLITLSGILSCTSILFAALVQFKIFGNATVIPPGEGRLDIYNGLDCRVFVHSSSSNVDVDRLDHNIDPLGMIDVSRTKVYGNDVVLVTLRFDETCNLTANSLKLDYELNVLEGKIISYHLTRLNPNNVSLNRVGNYDNLIKDKYGQPNVRILTDNTFDANDNTSVTLNSANQDSLISYSISDFRGMNFNIVRRGMYNIKYNGQLLVRSLDLLPATFYTITVQRNNDKIDVKIFTMEEGNYIHMLWQLPQYICMLMADIIFIVKAMEFAVFEAPANLKSFVTAIVYLTRAVGNLLIVIISAMSIKNQVYEYLLYSGLMCANILLLAYFSVTYKNESDSN